MTHVNSAPLTLAAVEKLTGLSREVLRKWALRYGFPQPLRGKRGERQFSASAVSRLQLQARLIAAGQRAGSVVPLDTAQLHALLARHPLASATAPTPRVLARQVQDLLQLLLAPADRAKALAQWLEDAIAHSGLTQFVAHTLPALNQAVGDAWQTGQIGIHAEHRYTEALRQAVTRALPPSPAHYPQLFSSRSCCAKHESGAHHLQTSIALPHQLMTRRGIIGSAKVAAQLSDQTHGLPQQQGLGQFFLPSP